MSLIVATLLPVFALMFVGLLAERLRLVPAGGAAALNQCMFNLGLPALIFVSVATRHHRLRAE